VPQTGPGCSTTAGPTAHDYRDLWNEKTIPRCPVWPPRQWQRPRIEGGATDTTTTWRHAPCAAMGTRFSSA